MTYRLMICSVADCACVVLDVYRSEVDMSLCLLTRPEDIESAEGPGRDTVWLTAGVPGVDATGELSKLVRPEGVSGPRISFTIVSTSRRFFARFVDYSRR